MSPIAPNRSPYYIGSKFRTWEEKSCAKKQKNPDQHKANQGGRSGVSGVLRLGSPGQGPGSSARIVRNHLDRSYAVTTGLEDGKLTKIAPELRNRSDDPAGAGGESCYSSRFRPMKGLRLWCDCVFLRGCFAEEGRQYKLDKRVDDRNNQRHVAPSEFERTALLARRKLIRMPHSWAGYPARRLAKQMSGARTSLIMIGAECNPSLTIIFLNLRKDRRSPSPLTTQGVKKKRSACSLF